MAPRETASVGARIVGWIRQMFRRRGNHSGGHEALVRKIGPPPHTLVARVAKLRDKDKDRDMLRLGEEASRRGHPDQAIIAYWKAARLFIKESHPLKAAAVLNRILGLEPRDVDAWLELVVCYEALERRKEAAIACSRAAELLELRGDDADAVLILEKCLAMQPGHPGVESRLSLLRARLVSTGLAPPGSGPHASRASQVFDVPSSETSRRVRAVVARTLSIDHRFRAGPSAANWPGSFGSSVGIAARQVSDIGLGESSVGGFDDDGAIELPDLEAEFAAHAAARVRPFDRREIDAAVVADATVADATMAHRPMLHRVEADATVAERTVDSTDLTDQRATDATAALALDSHLDLDRCADDPTLLGLALPSDAHSSDPHSSDPHSSDAHPVQMQVQRVPADRTVAESLPAAWMKGDGGFGPSTSPDARTPSESPGEQKRRLAIPDAATVLEARILPASLLGSEHEPKAREEAALHIANTTTRVHPYEDVKGLFDASDD